MEVLQFGLDQGQGELQEGQFVQLLNGLGEVEGKLVTLGLVEMRAKMGSLGKLYELFLAKR